MVHGTADLKNRRVCFATQIVRQEERGELQTVHDLRVAAAVSTETGTIVYIIYLLVIYYIVLYLYCSIYHIYIYI